MFDPHDTGSIDWGNALGETFRFYFTCGLAFGAYHFARTFVGDYRKPWPPSVLERVWRYVACLAIVGIIGGLASAEWNKDDRSDDRRILESFNYNKGALVFLKLVFPALIGVASGFEARKRGGIRLPPASTSEDSGM
jgi:hypothetical protein